MMNLEEYIRENHEAFNQGELPTGHQQRFLEKLKGEERKRTRQQRTSRLFIRTLLAAAAVCAIAFILVELSGSKIEKDYLSLLWEEEKEVMQLISKTDPLNGRIMQTALENITFEAIPLKEQLPPELPADQQKQILQDYYKQKVEGVQRLKQSLKNNK